jgi:hypothetical protein
VEFGRKEKRKAILSEMVGKAIIILYKIPNLKILFITADLPSPIIHMRPIVQPHEIEVPRMLRFMGNGQSRITFRPNHGEWPDNCRGHAGRLSTDAGRGWVTSMTSMTGKL